MDEWINEWMDEWMDGWMDEWMDGKFNQGPNCHGNKKNNEVSITMAHEIQPLNCSDNSGNITF